MKMKATISPACFRSFPLALFGLVALLILIKIEVRAQQHAGPASQADKKEKEAPPSGYLNKSAPSGLRFAAPPKPPVAYLPPLPISYDPQPVFSADFANPMADLPKMPSDNTPASAPAPTSAPVTELMSKLSPGQGKIPVSPVEMGSVNPQMLIKFFPNGKPAGTEAWIGDPVSFKVPVQGDKPSSSASYQVK